MPISKDRRVYINCLTPISRLFFPNLKEKVNVEVNGQIINATLAYRMQIAILKKLEGQELILFQELQQAVRTVAEKAFPLTSEEKAAGEAWEYPAGFRSPFIDGDVIPQGKTEPNENQAGHWILRCTTKNEVVLSDGTVDPMDVGIDPSRLYAGCFVRAQLTPFPWDTMGKTGVSLGMAQVMKYADGEALGYTPALANEVFGGHTAAVQPTTPGKPDVATNGLC